MAPTEMAHRPQLSLQHTCTPEGIVIDKPVLQKPSSPVPPASIPDGCAGEDRTPTRTSAISLGLRPLARASGRHAKPGLDTQELCAG